MWSIACVFILWSVCLWWTWYSKLHTYSLRGLLNARKVMCLVMKMNGMGWLQTHTTQSPLLLTTYTNPAHNIYIWSIPHNTEPRTQGLLTLLCPGRPDLKVQNWDHPNRTNNMVITITIGPVLEILWLVTIGFSVYNIGISKMDVGNM